MFRRKLFTILCISFILCGWLHKQSFAQSTVIQAQSRFVPTLLPAPLYFIDATTHQIIRLEVDGATNSAITDEPTAIISFDISQATGQIVYATEQMLVAVDGAGNGRRILYRSPEPPFDRTDKQLQRVLISPDGRQVAFAASGIHLLSLNGSAQSTLLLPNDAYTGTAEMPDVFHYYYLPKQWSPDGKRMLVTAINYFEGAKLTVLATNTLNDSLPIDLPDLPNIRCCSATWSLDSQSVIVAGSGGMSSPNGLNGLGRFVLNPDGNGSATAITLSSTISPSVEHYPFDRLFPQADGSLLAFSSQVPDTSFLSGVMVRITLDGARVTDITALRRDEYNFWNAVWAPDGSGAVIVQPAEGSENIADSPLTWLPSEDALSIQLPVHGQEPHWGVTSQQPSAALLQQANHDLKPSTLHLQNGHIALRSLGEFRTENTQTPIWVAFTAGKGASLSNNPPQLALYAQTDDAWHLLTKTSLRWDPAATKDTPYSLTPTSVQAVPIKQDELWLQVKTGDPTSVYFLLNFDHDSLNSQLAVSLADNIQSRLSDLDQDGILEVVLDSSLSNHDCPPCTGLNDPFAIIFRWDGERMEQIKLSPLPAAATESQQTINNLALRLVDAGMWQSALSELSQVGSSEQTDPTLKWNALLAETEVQSRIAAADKKHDWLLRYVYLDDYNSAVENILLQYPANQLFHLHSPLTAGTIVETHPRFVAEQILSYTQDIVTLYPDWASPHRYYSRAWAHYLLNPQDPTILDDLLTATELAADDARFADAYVSVRDDLSTSQIPHLIARKRVNVRLEPGTQYPILGQLETYQTAPIVGVSMDDNQMTPTEEAWYEIVYPANSGGRGWVSNASGLVWGFNTLTITRFDPKSPRPLSYLPPPTQLIVRTILVGSSQPQRLYALLSDEPLLAYPGKQAQLLISDDFGENWSPFVGGLPVSADCLLTVNLGETGLNEPQTDVLYASTCQGLYRWQADAWQLISNQQTGMVAAVPGQDDELWATFPFTTPFPIAQPALLHSTDGGTSWQGIPINHYNGVANLVIDPRDEQTGYAIIWPKYGGSYLRRGSATSEWQLLSTPVENHEINTGIAFDGNSATLYITLRTFEGAAQLWRTTDANAANPNELQWELVYDFGSGTWADLLGGGVTPDGFALYVNVRHFNENPTLYRSVNGGKDWHPLFVPTSDISK